MKKQWKLITSVGAIALSSAIVTPIVISGSLSNGDTCVHSKLDGTRFYQITFVPGTSGGTVTGQKLFTLRPGKAFHSIDPAIRPTATKAGYEFKGWTFVSSPGLPISETWVFRGDTALQPVFELPTAPYTNSDKAWCKFTSTTTNTDTWASLDWISACDPNSNIQYTIQGQSQATSVARTSFNQLVTLPTSLQYISSGFLEGCTNFNSGATVGEPTANLLTIPSNIKYVGGRFMHNCNNFRGVLDLSNLTTVNAFVSDHYTLASDSTAALVYTYGVQVNTASTSLLTAFYQLFPNEDGESTYSNQCRNLGKQIYDDDEIWNIHQTGEGAYLAGFKLEGITEEILKDKGYITEDPEAGTVTFTLPKTLTVDGNTLKILNLAGGAFANGGLDFIETITNIVIPYDIDYLPNNAFQNATTATSLKEISTSSRLANIKTIGNYCFDGCQYLEVINLSGTTTTIGSYAFRGCSSLLDAQLADATYIGDYAFSECTTLYRGSALPISSATHIGSHAFYNCSGVTTVMLHENIFKYTSYIGEDAFTGLNSAQEQAGRIEIIGDETFAGLTPNQWSLAEAILRNRGFGGDGKIVWEETATNDQWIMPSQYFTEHSVTPTYKAFDPSSFVISDEGVLSSLGNAATPVISESEVWFGGGVALIIPAEVTSIADGCNLILNYEGVTRVTFQEESSITKIGDWSMTSPYLKSIDFVTSYGGEEQMLTPQLTTIGDGAFADCDNEEFIQICLPNSILTIGDNAFMGCSYLSSLDLHNIMEEPSTVISILEAGSRLGILLDAGLSSEHEHYIYVAEGMTEVWTVALANHWDDTVITWTVQS